MTSYLKSKVIVYKKKVTNDWETTGNTMTQVLDVDVRMGLGNRKDVFTVKLLSSNDNLTVTKYSGNASTTVFTMKWTIPDSYRNTEAVRVYVNDVLQVYTTNYTISGTTLTFVSAPSSGTENISVYFNAVGSDDRIRIYLWKDSDSETDGDLIIEGTSTEPSYDLKSGIYTINGTGMSEIILNALSFARTPANNTPILIIQEVINNINNHQSADRKIVWSSSNSSTKSDGSAFSAIQYNSAYKRAIEIIEDVSSDKYTKDGQYIYNVRYNPAILSGSKYEFIWKYKSLDSSGNNLTQGNNVEVLKVSKNQDEIINAIIFNVGSDCNGNPIEDLNVGSGSMTGQGARWRYVDETSYILSTLIENEFLANPASFPVDASGRRTSNYPTSTAAWTFQFKTRDSTGEETGTSATATSDDTYNEALVKEAKAQGQRATKRILDLYSAPKIKAEVTVPLDNTYVVGDLFTLTSQSFNLTSYPLRCTEIQYSLYKTTLHLEEDEKTAISRIVGT